MPRLSQSLPRYRKHKPSGQAVVTLGGRDFYLGPHGTAASRREYDRLVHEWLARGRTAPVAANDLTINELLARYWKFASVYYAKEGEPTGETAAVKMVVRRMKALYGKTPASEFGPLALKAVRQKMIDDGLARTTINSQVARIRRLFKWGAAEQLVPAEVWTSLSAVEALRKGKTKANEAPPVLPVDNATVQATLEHLPETVADMVRLQRLTGMRPGEVCGLRPSEIDRSSDVWLYKPASHKTAHRGRGRVIPLGPQAQAVLLRYLARGADDHCFRPCDSEARRRAARHATRTTPLSCGNKPGVGNTKKPQRRAGKRYDTNSYGRAIHRACDKAGVDRWGPNRLRHSAATQIRQQFGIEAAQTVLGHSAPDVTVIYAERDLAKAVEVARAIG